MLKRSKSVAPVPADAGASDEAASLVKRLVEDRSLRDAVAALFDVAALETVAAEATPKKGRLRKLVLLVVVGGAAVLGASESARGKLLDALFGAEEEFEYNGPPAPQPPTGEAPGSPLSAV